MPDAPHQIRAPTSQASRLLPRSSEKVAVSGRFRKTVLQCLQTLEGEVQNESVFAIPAASLGGIVGQAYAPILKDRVKLAHRFRM